MSYAIGFRASGVPEKKNDQKNDQLERLYRHRLEQLKEIQTHQGEYKNPEEIKKIEIPEPKEPIFPEGEEMTEAQQEKLFMEMTKVIYGYDVRLAKLEIEAKEQKNILYELPEKIQGKIDFGMVGIVAFCAFGLCFGATALAIKIFL